MVENKLLKFFLPLNVSPMKKQTICQSFIKVLYVPFVLSIFRVIATVEPVECIYLIIPGMPVSLYNTYQLVAIDKLINEGD